LVLMLLVMMMYFISHLTSFEAIFTITRKIWMILQSPSLFVLFFIYNLFQHDQHSQGDSTVS
jgi:hypothetical protein